MFNNYMPKAHRIFFLRTLSLKTNLQFEICSKLRKDSENPKFLVHTYFVYTQKTRCIGQLLKNLTAVIPLITTKRNITTLASFCSLWNLTIFIIFKLSFTGNLLTEPLYTSPKSHL